MRVAQRTISRNYMTNLNNTLSKRADILARSESGLRFDQLSEDVAAGARAMSTQESRYAAEQQKNTAEALVKELDSAWKALGAADEIVQDILEEMKSAAGVRTEEKLEAIKEKIGAMKAQYLQTMNSQYGGKYLFGGTNNATPPFTEGDDGRLQFNGVTVANIYKYNDKYYYVKNDGDKPKFQTEELDEDGNPLVPPVPIDPPIPLDDLVPQSGKIYLDTGLGLTVTGDGVDSRTAFQVNVVGLDALGYIDFISEIDNGLPYDKNDPDQVEDHEAWINKTNNIYDLVSEVERLLSPNYSEARLDDMQLRLTEMNDTMRMARTFMDTQTTSLEYLVDRLKVDIDGMEKLEDSLMTAEPAGEAIKMKNVEYAWQAVLALGSQILPSSLLDYLS